MPQNLRYNLAAAVHLGHAISLTVVYSLALQDMPRNLYRYKCKHQTPQRMPAILDGNAAGNLIQTHEAVVLTRRLATVGIRSRETHTTRTQTMARKACHGLPAFVFIPPNPSGWAEERRQKRIRARDCLRRSRVRARPRFWRAPQVA